MPDRGGTAAAGRGAMRWDDRRRLVVAAALALALDACALAALAAFLAGGSKAALRDAERSWVSVELDPGNSPTPEARAGTELLAGTELGGTERPQGSAPVAARRPEPASALPVDPAPRIAEDGAGPAAAGAEPSPAESTATAAGAAAVSETRGDGARGADAGTGPDGAPVSTREDILARLDEAIDRELVYPPRARERGIEGRVVLEIGVDEIGALRACAVDTSSGSAMLDAAARRLIAGIFPLRARLAAPFSALVAIDYRLR